MEFKEQEKTKRRKAAKKGTTKTRNLKVMPVTLNQKEQKHLTNNKHKKQHKRMYNRNAKAHTVKYTQPNKNIKT